MREGDTGRIPLSGLAWARPSINNRLGPEVKRPADVVKPGDVVYVEALAGEGTEAGTFGLRQVPAVNGAIVAIDPFTGHIVALSGGFSYGSSQFDRAMQAMRQPGSTFKPFVYATALDNGYTPVTKVLDAPFAVEQGPFLPLWTPDNYEAGEYLGLTTLRRGMELSRNVMTARLAHTIGMEAVAETAERMGVYEKLPRFLANSLGAEVTTLLKMTAGYAEFVNGGRKLEPTLIDRVQDRFGKTVYRFDKRDCKECSQAEWKGQEEPLLEENKPQVLDPRTRLSDGLDPRRRGPARHRRDDPLGRQAARRQDRNVLGLSRRLVHRLLARSRGRRLYRLRRFPQPRSEAKQEHSPPRRSSASS